MFRQHDRGGSCRRSRSDSNRPAGDGQRHPPCRGSRGPARRRPAPAGRRPDPRLLTSPAAEP
ncbi:hypothetical protein E0504_41350 [Parafrankia sp. BMG5.11]|nr:hypothetical protein E0504_41350 [Parafrankia sp. BMG5.11]